MVAASVECIIQVLQCLEEISAQYGLLINVTKMKIMVINRPENNSPQIQEVNGIEVVNRFAYLGFVV